VSACAIVLAVVVLVTADVLTRGVITFAICLIVCIALYRGAQSCTVRSLHGDVQVTLSVVRQRLILPCLAYAR
jgi:hypothetical protein